MSSGGQLVGGTFGALTGFLIGGPTGALYGAQIGLAVGGYLDPPKGPKQQGPRLDDLSVQTATYGAFIPRGYGTFPVTGNIFWLENNQLAETVTENEVGGKGGGSKGVSESFSYSATFAVGLLDCTDGTPITGIGRIWIANKPFSDAGSTELTAVLATNMAAQFFTLHKGESDQLPDERMQATLEVANTPAYRGLAYIVFKDFPLAQYGNSLVGLQVKVEVIKDGGISASFVGPTSTPSVRSIYGEDMLFFKEQLWLVGGRDQSLGGIVSTTMIASADGQNFFEFPNNFPGAAANEQQVLVFNDQVFLIFKNNTKEVWKTVDMVTWVYVGTASGIPSVGSTRFGHGVCVHDGKLWLFGGGTGGGIDYNDVWNSDDGVTWTLVTANAGWHTRFGHVTMSYGGKLWVFQGYSFTGGATLTNDIWNSDDGVTWTHVSTPSALLSPHLGAYYYKVVQFHDAFWFIGGQLHSGAWSNSCVSTMDFVTFTVETISPSWTAASHISAAIGWGGTLFVHGGYLPVVHHYQDPIVGVSPTLGSIVNAECLRSNLLSSGDIDTSLLTQDVRGYRVAGVTSIRSVIEPLQGAWPFDVVQSNYQIKFKPRGSASVATIAAAELDARSVGDSPGVSITNSREMEMVLPRRVTLDYMDIWRAYDTGSQYAERLNTQAVNVQAISLAIVLNASEAAGIAETLLYLYWLERYDVTFALPPTRSALEPGDVIVVNAAEATYNLRLTAITYTADGLLECTAKYDSAAIYAPAALGEEGQATESGMTLQGGTVFRMLDIPLIVDAHDVPGYPIAMAGYLDGWPGGVLFRSDDAGQTWTNLQGVTAPGTLIAHAINSLSAVSTALIDKSSVLSVRFYTGGPSSVSELAMLNGANHFAYGTDDRWEIIAAQNCTLQGDGSYLLTDLLRGRSGTEWAMSLHVVGDYVVALDSSLQFVTSNSSSIGLTRLYRAVTAGRNLESSIAESHTYAGVNLECLSPVYINGSRHPTTNDWTLTWIRRTRKGGEWRDYVDALWGENQLLFDVEIYSSGAYTTLKRTFSNLTSETTPYTSAQQVTDFGSNQATLYVKIYQISQTVGRGYPLTTSITR